ncbi:hypothetical protein B0H14DRAFT_2598713 [Mycena olivaceomarginata]|nr:hypothetical protein B0H14DRAFT_2598713 [Mycena olivaceomarginata]
MCRNQHLTRNPALSNPSPWVGVPKRQPELPRTRRGSTAGFPYTLFTEKGSVGAGTGNCPQATVPSSMPQEASDHSRSNTNLFDNPPKKGKNIRNQGHKLVPK